MITYAAGNIIIGTKIRTIKYFKSLLIFATSITIMGTKKIKIFSKIINDEKLRSKDASNNLLIFFLLFVSSKNILMFLQAAHNKAEDNINLKSTDSIG